MASNALSRKDLLLLGSLFLLESSIILIAMSLHKKGERSFTLFFSSRPGVFLMMAIAASFMASIVIVHQYLTRKRLPRNHFKLIVTMNMVTVILILLIGEGFVRAGSRNSPEGITLGATVLRPRDWNGLVARNRSILERAADGSYLMYDDRLGWTIRPSSRSADGMYYSSAEGIRAHNEAVSFSKHTEKTRIALVGDSFTFGSEVSYEDTWGYRLGQELGAEFQVLNFGVPSYGVDQIYLRYEKDVPAWRPRIVILSFIADDLERTMTVYTPIAFPRYELPFSKPRFILHNENLQLVNVPTLTPEHIFSHSSISELPFLEYESRYKPSLWQHSPYHLSYLIRLLSSWSTPPAMKEDSTESDDASVAVNGAILKSFVRSTHERGIVPIVVYLPRRETMPSGSGSIPSIVRRTLQASGITFTDLTPCLLKLNLADRFMPGTHYSPQGNAVISNCLKSIVQEMLPSLSVPAIQSHPPNGEHSQD